MIIPIQGKSPIIHETAFVAPSAAVIGDTTIGENSSIWFGAVLRGDEDRIVVGNRSSIQDNAVIHCDAKVPAIIGDDVTVGHNATLHSCVIGSRTVIGMGAVILNGASVGEDCIIAAGSVVKGGSVIPPKSLAAGVPAEVKKELSDQAAAQNKANAEEYVRLTAEYRKNT